MADIGDTAQMEWPPNENDPCRGKSSISPESLHRSCSTPPWKCNDPKAHGLLPLPLRIKGRKDGTPPLPLKPISSLSVDPPSPTKILSTLTPTSRSTCPSTAAEVEIPPRRSSAAPPVNVDGRDLSLLALPAMSPFFPKGRFENHVDSIKVRKQRRSDATSSSIGASAEDEDLQSRWSAGRSDVTRNGPDEHGSKTTDSRMPTTTGRITSVQISVLPPAPASVRSGDETQSRICSTESSITSRPSGSATKDVSRTTSTYTTSQGPDDAAEDENGMSRSASMSVTAKEKEFLGRRRRDSLTGTRGLSRAFARLDILDRFRAGSHRDSEDFNRGVDRQSSQRNSLRESSSSGEQSSRSRSTTYSSGRTDASTQSSLDRTIASFPLPPQTKPWLFPKADGDNCRTQNGGPDPDSIDSAMLAAAVTITPEVKSLDINGGQSLWVAVEVAGDVDLGVTTRPCAEEGDGVDIVVCLDLSASASCSTLANSREITLLVASMLDARKDRLGIVTTQTFESSAIVSRLTSVNIKKVRAFLGQMKGAGQRQPSESALESVLKMAADLLSSARKTRVDEQRGDDFRPRRLVQPPAHIILLSSHVGTGPLEVAGGHLVHIVNPAIVPWSNSQGHTSGWQLCSMFPSRLNSTALSQEGGNLAGRLEKLIQLARGGTNPGELREVAIDIQSGPRYEIETILGEPRWARLNAGQTAQLFVRLKAGQSPVRRLASNDSRPDETDEDCDDSFAELDAMLGEATAEALTVEVTYRHSLLPQNTKLSVGASCSLKRHTAGAPWNRWSGVTLQDNINQQAKLQRRLAFFLAATCQGQRQALAILQDLFGEAACLSACPAYVKQIKEELRYQARITERFQGTTGGDASVGNKAQGAAGDPSPAGVRNQMVMVKPEGIVYRPRLDRATSTTSVGEALRIWRDMRKTSVVQTLDQDGRVVLRTLTPPEARTDQLLKVADDALRNKRSIGQDTLRSIARESSETGHSAPWW